MSHKIITIARQFGSGGHEVAERLSRRLRIPLYDRSLVEMAAREMNLSPVSVEKVDETALRSFLSTYHVPEDPAEAARYGLPLTDQTYLVQKSLIEKLAAQGPCIIVGRCGNFILKDWPGLIDVFLCAEHSDRLKRIVERYGISERDAASALRRTDGRRKQYYETYAGKSWGNIESHQMMMNVSLLGIDRVVDVLEGVYTGRA